MGKQETKFRFAAFDVPFVTLGKDIEFYHSTTKEGRAQIWFHEYAPPPEVPDAEYSFWLCTGRVLEHWHSGSMTRRVQIKMVSGMGAGDSTTTLVKARELLGLGQVAAIQIRYHYEQQDWCDTLMVFPHAIRIVRTIDR